MALVWHEKASPTDTQHDNSQGHCRTMLSIISKLAYLLYTLIKLFSLHEHLADSVDLNI